MAKLSNQVVEKLAVEAIQNEVSKNSPLLNSKLSVGDKEISFDGALELHNSDHWSTKSFVANVPVQVKGKQNSDFNQKSVSFSLKLDHYRNYYKSGGVLFFLVLVNKDKQSKIYYKQLLPLELDAIISNHGHQEKCTMKLYALENNKIQDICLDFCDSQHKQPLVLIEHRSSSPRSMNRLVMKSPTFHSDNLFDHDIFDHGFDIYEGYNDEILLPMMHAHIEEIQMSSTQIIYIDNEMTDVYVTFSSQKDQFSIILDEILSLKYDLKKRVVECTLKGFGSLLKQSKIVPVIIALISEKEVKINNYVLPKINLPSNSITSDLDQLNAWLSEIKRAMMVFELFDVPVDILIEKSESNNLDEQICLLNAVILDRNYRDVELSSLGISSVACISLGTINFVTVYSASKESRFMNPFDEKSPKTDFIIEFELTGKRYPYNIFSMINLEILISATNITAQKIINEFDKIHPFLNNDIKEVTVAFCLNCIRAYDQSGKRDLLIAAQYILKKYPNFADTAMISNEGWCSNYMNVIQIDVRLHGYMSTEDEHVIRNIMHEPSYYARPVFLFGAAVLLKNKSDATYFLNKLEEKDQEAIKNFPIYTLYQTL